jgi:tetrathionate reductase subunit B
MHFQPGNCMHCDNPTCVQACPTSATYKDDKDGTIKVNKKLCIGCGSCIPACPYGARYRHPEEKVVDKCDFCEHRRARGELPACVTTCPTKARTFGDLKDPNSEVARLLKDNNGVRVVNRETDTQPNIYYLSMTAPIDWPVKAEIPAAIQLWKVINPFVWGFVGLNVLGVLAMLGKQLLIKDEPLEVEHK